MLLQLDFKSGKPVYLQLVDQIRYAAAAGALRPGEPLPSIRPLAEELRVNRNTVAKAYVELERQGVIETIPGKGCFLSENNSPFSKHSSKSALISSSARAQRLRRRTDEAAEMPTTAGARRSRRFTFGVWIRAGTSDLPPTAKREATRRSRCHS
ncbi:MAG: GntR family transcriptional regulator [Verrucomicrobia bacterium]|nr:MAG: GntR family transcriptional regulator [Verrucomicrobiota bacterium]